MIRKASRRDKIEKILNEYKDLKKISGIKSQKAKELIPGMKDSVGSLQHQRQSIANVFATFYEELYKDVNKDTNDLQHNYDQQQITISNE